MPVPIEMKENKFNILVNTCIEIKNIYSEGNEIPTDTVEDLWNYVKQYLRE